MPAFADASLGALLDYLAGVPAGTGLGEQAAYRALATYANGPVVLGSGLYVGGVASAPGTLALTADRLLLAPWFVGGAVTYDRIGIEITTPGTAGALLRLGIFSLDANGVSLTRVLDAGTLDGTQAAGHYNITVHCPLPPGTYFLGLAAQGGAATPPTVRAQTANTAMFVGQLTSPTATQAELAVCPAALKADAVSGAFPASFAGPLARVNQAHAMSMRVK